MPARIRALRKIVSEPIYKVLSDSLEGDWSSLLNIPQDVKALISYAKPHEIRLVYEDVGKIAPVSVPGKLLLILHSRFLGSDQRPTAGINIVTPFLLNMYVERLEAYIIELAHYNAIEPYFIDWLERENHFTNIMINVQDH